MKENKTLKACKFARVRTDGLTYGQSRDNQICFSSTGDQIVESVGLRLCEPRRAGASEYVFQI